MRFQIDRAAAILVFLYPALLLSVRSGANACFLLLIVLAVFEIWRTRGEMLVGAWDQTALLYAIAMASLAVATFISQAYHLHFTGSAYDGASRFLFAVPIYLMLRRVQTRFLTSVQYGFVCGALFAVVVVLLFPSLRGDRLGTYFLNLIHFGNLALIVGLVAGLSINWDRKDRVIVIALKILALLAGVWISIASGTRGGWIAIPAIALVWALLQRQHISQRLMALATVALVAAILIVYALVAPVHERINALAYELRAFEQLKDTSTGLRIQIWAAALHLFAQYPVFGVGPDRFAEHVPALAHAGYLTPNAMVFGRAEVHNEILNRAVTLGVFGLASILLIYLVPFILFLRAARAPSKVHRTAALLGACFVTGFFVFGLTVEIFNLKTTATFYSLTVAVLLAIATNRAETS